MPIEEMTTKIDGFVVILEKYYSLKIHLKVSIKNAPRIHLFGY
jgi:hypothetical protein